MHELAAEVRVCYKTVLNNLHDIVGYRKHTARWIHHEISELQQWHYYAVAHALLHRYQREGDDILDELSLWTKPALTHMNHT